MEYIDLQGEYQVTLKDGRTYPAVLPGTLDTNQIGERETVALKWHPDAAIDDTGTFTDCGVILTRLTRKHTYEGPAVFTRSVTLHPRAGERLFLEAERARQLALRVNGRDVPHYEQGTVSTPHVFEITSFVREGENTIGFVSDNSYPGWPHDPIVFSSAATDETQTNWNGLIGRLRIRIEQENFIAGVRVYPARCSADIAIEVDCAQKMTRTFTVRSEAFGTRQKSVSLREGRSTVWLRGVPLQPDVRLWDEDEGALYAARVSADGFEERCVTFGVRTVGKAGGRLTFNGRTIFLRCEANCALFPETGHWPMDKESWRTILQKYRDYGANCVRFHSHCPPEAAFEAADEMGMLMQPELSHWNPKTAFEDDVSYAYYRLELAQVLKMLANHPSFIMLTFGNELAAESKGHKRMQLLLRLARQMDKTRLFASGSNNHYGWFGPDLTDDFYAATNLYEHELRATFAGMGGYLNRDYPDARHNFDEGMRSVREEFDGPVEQFEVGQYEVLPDFDELALFQGVTSPDNLVHVRDRVEGKGLLPVWKRRVEASGELSLLCYREEVEACLRTRGLSGISLLSLQDFTGQGTALVGMMNSHLESKPFSFADPARFAAFFASVLPLALLPRYTCFEGQRLTFRLAFANYGKGAVTGAAKAELVGEDGRAVCTQMSAEKTYVHGKLHHAHTFSLVLPRTGRAEKYTLNVMVGEYRNEYPVWVYPKAERLPAGVTVTDSVEEAIAALRRGGRVLLDPVSDEAHFPQSVKAQFSTDFWSVGTFPSQSGFMGVCVDETHPAFAQFPTSFHSDWQWWQLTSHRAMILPDGMQSIVTGLDSYARLRNLSLLFEVKVGAGRLLVSSMNLTADRHLPEVGAMLASLCAYAASDAFDPAQDMTEETLCALVK